MTRNSFRSTFRMHSSWVQGCLGQQDLVGKGGQTEGREDGQQENPYKPAIQGTPKHQWLWPSKHHIFNCSTSKRCVFWRFFCFIKPVPKSFHFLVLLVAGFISCYNPSKRFCRVRLRRASLGALDDAILRTKTVFRKGDPSIFYIW